MTEFKVGDRVKWDGIVDSAVGTITRITSGATRPYFVQYDNGHEVSERGEELILVAAEPSDFLDACEQSSDMLASVQAEENDATIIEQKFVDAMIGIQEFFDARPEVRRSFGGGTMVDKNLIAYAARLEEENRALQAANRRLQDKLVEEARLLTALQAEIAGEDSVISVYACYR